MDIKSILGMAAGVAGTAYPPLGAVIGIVNEFLPEDEKLPVTSTGADVKDKLDKLPPEMQSSLMEKKIDLQIANEEGWTERFKAMAENDKQSTRPKIALLMAWLLILTTLVFAVVVSYAVFTGNVPNNLSDLWVLFGALTASPAGLLAKYYGDLKQEQKSRAGAISGVSNVGVVSGLLSNYLSPSKG